MQLDEFLESWYDDRPSLLVHTSGSTGAPKPLWVQKKKMVASARMTCRFLGLNIGDVALLCMPLDYIAGKMMVVRAEVAKMRLLHVTPSGHPLADDAAGDQKIDFAAMVPLQVYNSLQVERENQRLRNIRVLIIGGGAIDDSLECQLRDFPNAVWSTYGMTETLSHIAMRRLNGVNVSPWYVPLPGVDVSVDVDGCLVIHAPLLCDDVLKTNDIVELDEDRNQFIILGRKDNVICSGGIKLQAEQIEKKLFPHMPCPFYISKQKDAKYGEIPVLVTESMDNKLLEDILQNVLPKYWIPKKIVMVSQLPTTETGKPKRSVIPQ
jgi:O-succinylbenzoic acid--CoA ligase